MSIDEHEQADPFAEIADEFVTEYRNGKHPRIEDYVERYPDLADEIRDLLPTQIMMEQVKSPEESNTALNNDQWSDLVGTQISDYRIVREIGRGGMGVVYEAEQISLGRHVAIKILPEQRSLKSNHALRFQREAKAAARLHHTNIVPVFGVGEDKGLNYYVMQYIHGLGLDEVLDQLRQLRDHSSVPQHADNKSPASALRSNHLAQGLLSGQPTSATPASLASHSAMESAAIASGITGGLLNDQSEATQSNASSIAPSNAQLGISSPSSNNCRDPYWRNIARIGLQISDALHYAHDQGIAHRDIKPSNILLDIQNTAWITDFGLAKTEDEANITRSGDILGTIRYMPPEAFEGQADTRSDIYVLGITLYELATLTPAFSGSDRHQLIKQVTMGTPEPISKSAQGIPRDLATIIGKAIERDPADRYADAAELHDDLRRCLDDVPILARRASSIERLSRWARQNRALAASMFGVLALLSLIAVVGFITAAYFLDQKEKQKTLYQQANEMAQSNAEILGKLEVALDDSVNSANEAARARDVAQQQSEQTRRNLYSANMLDALTTLSSHRGLARAQSLLDAWRPEAGQQDSRGWEWYYLKSLCHQHASELGSHETPVKAMAKNAEGTRLASISDDGELKFWNPSSNELLKSISSGIHLPRCMSWDTNRQRIAVGGQNGFIILNAETLETVYRSNKDSIVHGLSFSPDGKWLARLRQNVGGIQRPDIELLETETFTPVHQLSGFSRSLFGVGSSWSDDSKRFAYPADRRLYVWDVEQAEQAFVSRVPSLESIHAVRFHPTDPNRVATCGRNGMAEIWNLNENTVELKLRGHTHGISDLRWHSNGERLVTVSWDVSLRYWDTATGKQLRMINGHDRHIFCLLIDDEFAWTGGYEGAIKAWQLDQPKCRQVLDKLPSGFIHLRFPPNESNRVAVANAQGELQIVELSAPRNRQSIPNQATQLRDLDFSPDRKRLAVVGQEGQVQVWNLATGVLDEETSPLASSNETELRQVKWSPDGSMLAVGSYSGKLLLLDSDLRLLQDPIDTGLQQLLSLEIAPDGKTIAMGGTGGIKLFDVERGTEIEFPSTGTWCSKLRWSHDGTRLAVANDRQAVVVWDVQNQQVIAELFDTYEPIFGIAWGKDDRRLCTVDARANLTIWDVEMEQPTLKFHCGIGEVRATEWSEDGRKLIVGCGNDVILFDATTGFTVEKNETTASVTP